MHPDIDKLPHRGDDPQTRAVVQRLRDLPDGFQPPYDWAEFQRRAEVLRSTGPSQHGRRYAALAACFALLVAGLALWIRFGATDTRSMVAASSAQEEGSIQPAARGAQAELRAEWLERWEEPVIVRVGSRLATAELEDRIAYVDDLLSAERADDPQPERVAQLQRERERLAQSLIQLRYAEVLTARLP
jgi:hypothetical protein